MITFITDFGIDGPYAGAMKGVILSICPEASIIDITHSVDPQQIDQAAWIIAQSAFFFPAGTIHVIVVDPGVGSSRAVLGVRALGHQFLAPDNGVLKMIFDSSPEAEVFKITKDSFFRKPLSQTFHGRDIFAPVAAHLEKGTRLEDLGEKTDRFIRGDIPRPSLKGKMLTGQIFCFDPFGNAITNIHRSMLRETMIRSIRCGSFRVSKLNNHYSETPAGGMAALIGSGETLELSLSMGNLRRSSGLKIGDPVVVEFN